MPNNKIASRILLLKPPTIIDNTRVVKITIVKHKATLCFSSILKIELNGLKHIFKQHQGANISAYKPDVLHRSPKKNENNSLPQKKHDSKNWSADL
jgi:hypothetical protein